MRPSHYNLDHHYTADTMMETHPDENGEVGDTTFGFMENARIRDVGGETVGTAGVRCLAAAKAQRVVELASESLKALRMSEDFQIQQEEFMHPPLNVHHCQFELGILLGQGTFSSVLEIRSSQVETIEPSNYALKMLRRNMAADPDLFAASAAGLVTEATILSLLDHKHIIRVKAWSHRGVCGYSKGTSDAFFLILDRLDNTLSDRILEWKRQVDNVHIFARHRNESIHRLLVERLQVAKDIASAISYLHQRRIIHRDIKPSNIGFQRAQVKLFDFDVSRFLPKQVYEGQLFNLTGLTGTRRYMSPENALHEPYNEKTDVYSFAMLLHEIITMEKAFRKLTKREHELRVFHHNTRPCIPHSFPRPIRLIIAAGWSREIEVRPSIHEIRDELERIVHQGAPGQLSYNIISGKRGFRSDMKRLFTQTISIA
jgi:serine/threonine protein kinase